MTIANQIKAFYTTQTERGDKVDVSALTNECEEKAVTVDQDWDNESTTYVFADDSCIVCCGSEVSAYGCAQ